MSGCSEMEKERSIADLFPPPIYRFDESDQATTLLTPGPVVMSIAAISLSGPTDHRLHHPTFWLAAALMMPSRSRWWVDAGASRAACPRGAWSARREMIDRRVL